MLTSIAGARRAAEEAGHKQWHLHHLGRAPSQAMEMLPPHPTSSGTTGWGAREGLVLHGRGTWTQQGEQAGTVTATAPRWLQEKQGTSRDKTSLAAMQLKQEKLGMKYRN